MIEALENRIAPAAVLHFTDLDGDKITVTASKGTKADLTAACAIGGLGLSVDLIATAQMAQDFAGTDLTIAAQKAGGGNGTVEVSRIHASDSGGANDVNLGKVSVAGNLGSITAGKFDPVIPALKSLNVKSLTDNINISAIVGNVGQITVLHDLTSFLQATTIGKLVVGGSVLGGSAANSGRISTTNINSMTVGGDVQRGSGSQSGNVYADNTLGSMTVKGSIVGGTTTTTGIVLARVIGKLVVNGDVQGGTGGGSFPIPAGGIGCTTFTSIVIKGSLIGGSGTDSGSINASGMIANGSIKIGGNVTGGTNAATGLISSVSDIASLTIGAKLDGNNQAANQDAGTILCPSIGKLSIGQFVNGAQILP